MDIQQIADQPEITALLNSYGARSTANEDADWLATGLAPSR